jgi:hypothetical protein
VFEKKKKTMITFITFFDGVVAKKGDDNYRNLFQWFCCEKGDGNNVVTFFYGGGGGVKKAMVASCRRLFFSCPFGMVY